jgi:hypothetical protein
LVSDKGNDGTVINESGSGLGSYYSAYQRCDRHEINFRDVAAFSSGEWNYEQIPVILSGALCREGPMQFAGRAHRFFASLRMTTPSVDEGKQSWRSKKSVFSVVA